MKHMLGGARAALAGLTFLAAGASHLTGVAVGGPMGERGDGQPVDGAVRLERFERRHPSGHERRLGGRIQDQLAEPGPEPDSARALERHELERPCDPADARPRREIQGMSSTAHNDVWAVGTTGDLINDAYKTFAMHWNGSSWTLVPRQRSRSPTSACSTPWRRAAKTTRGPPDRPPRAGLLERWNGQHLEHRRRRARIRRP